MAATAGQSLRERREAIVVEHIAAENRQDVEATIATVIGEARITGTHSGAFAGIPPTGRRIDVPMAAIFDFEEDRLLCEKVYYDIATILVQLGVLPAPAAA